MPPSSLNTPARWSGLDGLRALAVIAVVAFHFAPSAAPGGFLGVDLFFVLSGYLITRMIVTEYLTNGSLRFGNFYLRRARRLLPGLAVVVTATLAAAAFWRDQLTTVRPAVGAAVGYVSNWWLSYAHQSYFVTAGRPSMLQHLWSLAIEEQYYLFWPLIAITVLSLAAKRHKPTALSCVAVVMALASSAEMAAIAISHNVPDSSDGSRLYYGTDTHSMGLLLGSALGALAAGRAVAAVRPDGPRRIIWLTDLLGWAALVALVVIVYSVHESSPALYRGGFFGVAALAAVVTASVARAGSRLGSVLDRRPLRWIAARSYSIYLWHWPVAVVTRPGIDVHWPAPVVLLVRVGATVLLADVTHRLVELPIRSGGFRRSLRAGVRRLSRVIVGTAPVGARLATAGLVALILMAAGVLATGPKATLSAVQKALAEEHGGRHLRLGPTTPPPPAPRRTGPLPTLPSSTPTRRPSPRPQRPSTSPVANTQPLPTISAYGDSVMLGARLALDNRFPGGTLDAVEGRQPGPILQDAEHDAAAGKLNQIVVIGVGDNGLINRSDLVYALHCLRDVRRVIVVNNRVGRPWEGPNNAIIASVVPHFGNAKILDWYARSAGRSDWFYDDGIHLTSAGATAYTRLIASSARG